MSESHTSKGPSGANRLWFALGVTSTLTFVLVLLLLIVALSRS